MRLDTSMNQRMEQKMILAPRMIQSMEILQLPIMALQERIQQELQENPVLELKDEAGDGTQTAEETEEQPAPEPDDSGDSERELVIDDTGNNELDFDRLEALSRDWEDHFNEEPSRLAQRHRRGRRHESTTPCRTCRRGRSRSRTTSPISSLFWISPKTN